jgi:site-specific DNA-methyltransferase (adenine-specific)
MPKRTRSQPASPPVRQFPDDKVLGRIHQGDCIAGMNGLPAGSIDLVFADPPFNIGYDYDVYHDAKDYEEYLAWSRQWIGAVHRVLKPDGTFWLAIGDEYAAELKLESQKLGFHIRSWVIWYYTFGVNCKTKFSRSHAHLFHFVKDARQFTFRAEELENRVPSARLLVYGDSRGNPDGRLPDDTWILRPQDLAGHFSVEEDTWFFSRVAGTFKERRGFHGCQMPEQLLGRIIRLCSHENEIVLDPFSGSATTLAVAKKLQRRFVGFDLSEDYAKRGSDRLAAIRIGDSLDGAVEPTMSAPATHKIRTAAKQGKKNKLANPLQLILDASEKEDVKWSQKIYSDGLIEAFKKVSNGFSVDRVVADPDLDAAFRDACCALSLPGDIRWWNRELFQLRKSGKLSHFPTERRTEISWETCDAFLFASEIAWKTQVDRGFNSLDDILCDPAAAAEFDQTAALLAPGFTPLEYRWGALKLRKESKRTRCRAGTIGMRNFREPFSDPLAIKGQLLSRIPETAGVYLVGDGATDVSLYAGEALRLRSRLESQFSGPAKRFWQDRATRLVVRFFEVQSEMSLLLAYQTLCVTRHRPKLNLPEIALT